MIAGFTDASTAHVILMSRIIFQTENGYDNAIFELGSYIIDDYLNSELHHLCALQNIGIFCGCMPIIIFPFFPHDVYII